MLLIAYLELDVMYILLDPLIKTTTTTKSFHGATEFPLYRLQNGIAGQSL